MSLKEEVRSEYEQEKEYTVLMTSHVYAIHKSTVWAYSKDEAIEEAEKPGYCVWDLVSCDPNDMVIGGHTEYEVED